MNMENRHLEKRKGQVQELIQLTERYLNLNRWGFRLTFSDIVSDVPPRIIYDSEWCRVMFSHGGRDQLRGTEIDIYYGRLHAANDKFVIVLGEDKYNKYRCWHHVDPALNFLDGLSPEEAVEQWAIQRKMPNAMEQFKVSEVARKISQAHYPEWLINLHNSIWEQYGERLFEIFDLRRPDLWERYVHYLRSYYKIMGASPYPGTPGYDQIY